MSSDRMKRDWRARRHEPIKLCALTQKVMDGRYVRWSWRYNSWQQFDSTVQGWRNTSCFLQELPHVKDYQPDRPSHRALDRKRNGPTD